MRNYIIIFLLSLLAVWPFFKKGFFESHDGEWMVIRFSAFHQTLRDGQFPVRFVDRLNNNYGYPVFNYLYPLPFYLAEVPKVIGFGFVESIKIVFIFSTIGSAIAMYLALSQIYRKSASLAGAVLYLFAPYRFVDLYVRGSLGESVAFLFLPLVMFAIFKVGMGNLVFLPVLSIFLGLLITSHNVIALIFMPIIIFFALSQVKLKLLTIAFIALGVFLASFFWIPALLELKIVKLSQIEISRVSQHLASFERLLVPSWGYGYLPNESEGFSPQVGLVAIAAFIGAFYVAYIKKNRNLFVDTLFIFSLVSFLLMSRISLPFWMIGGFDLIQFPWRLLSVTAFCASFLIAFSIDKAKSVNVLAIIIIAASIISTITYIRPKIFVNQDESFYSTNEDTTTVRNEYLPIWISVKNNTRANEKITLSQDYKVIESQIKFASYRASLNAQKDSKVLVSTIYFPGWKVFIDGKSTPIDIENNSGLISFQLPKGLHQVIIDYQRSKLHLTSEAISLLSILILTLSFYFTWQRKNS